MKLDLDLQDTLGPIHNAQPRYLEHEADLQPPQ